MQSMTCTYAQCRNMFAMPGDTVVDLCCGSGSAPVAAVLAGLNYIAVDVSADAVL